MNAKSFIIILICVVNIVSTANSQESWIRFQPLDMPLTLALPGVPKYESQEVLTDIGQVLNSTYVLEMPKEHPNFLYMVTQVVYPEGIFDEEEEITSEMLDEAIISLAAAHKCEPVYQREDRVDGADGRLFRLMDKDHKMVVKGRLCIWNGQMLAVQVFSYADRSLNETMDRVLDSFHLKKQ